MNVSIELDNEARSEPDAHLNGQVIRAQHIE
jgi:hypothetical protein